MIKNFIDMGNFLYSTDNKVDIIKRLRQVRQDLNLGSGDFARGAGIDPRNYSSIENNKRAFGERVLKDICNAYDVDLNWLRTGEGEMFRGKMTVREQGRGIPFYDIDVTGGITESFSDFPEMAQYRINYPPLNDCTAAFPVYGESMEPDFYSGEVVLVKEITKINSMLWGEPYLVITNANCDNLRTIKNVYISDDRKNFILRASNPRFAGDTLVPCTDVLKIFMVKGKVSRRQL